MRQHGERVLFLSKLPAEQPKLKQKHTIPLQTGRRLLTSMVQHRRTGIATPVPRIHQHPWKYHLEQAKLLQAGPRRQGCEVPHHYHVPAGCILQKAGAERGF